MESHIYLVIRCLTGFKNDMKPKKVKPESVTTFMNSWNTKVDKSIWNPSNCRSWYQDKNGRPWAMWPDPVWKYYQATSNINPKEHFLYYL